MLGKAARKRTAAGAGSHDNKIDKLVLPVLPHRYPPAGTEYIGRAAIGGARGSKGII